MKKFFGIQLRILFAGLLALLTLVLTLAAAVGRFIFS